MIDKGWDGMRNRKENVKIDGKISAIEKIIAEIYKENVKTIGKLSAIEKTIVEIRAMQTGGASI